MYQWSLLRSHHCLNSAEATQVVWVNPSFWTCSSNTVAKPGRGWGGSPLPQFRFPGLWLRLMVTDHTPGSTRTESAQLLSGSQELRMKLAWSLQCRGGR